jgi:phenylacetate-CoA ligase
MFLTSLHERAVGLIFFPFTQYLYNRKRINVEFRRTLKTETMSSEKMTDLQMQKLSAVLHDASARVPYYERLFNQAGIRPDSIKNADDIRRIPPLSRDDLVKNKNDLIDRRFHASAAAADLSGRRPGAPAPFARFQRFPLVKNTSSGSTGAPTVFYEDGTISAMSWANELRVKRWFGLGPGAAEARFVRVSPEYSKKNMSNRFRRFFWNQTILPGVNLTGKEYSLIIDQLRRFRPKILWGFTSAVAGLARFIKDNPDVSNGVGPTAVITWAAPLYDHERAIIRDVFHCPVANIYGMREVGHIGAYCPEGSFHVFQESHFLETDSNGELLVTFLRPTPMPFIRYRTGDIGELATGKCACGRNLQIIKHLHGRTGEIFTTQDGKMFSPNFWCRTFMESRLAETVKRFQIIYEKNETIKIRLIVDKSHHSEVESRLKAVVANNFNAKTGVNFEYVDAIAPQLSGKYQMVINERNINNKVMNTADKTSEPSMSAPIVDYSDIDYRKYWIGEHMRLFDYQEKAIVSAWLRNSTGWFIDLGCGFGRMVPLYFKKLHNIVLVDYAMNNLEMIRAEYPNEPFVYIAADACKLPFRTSSFDSGISVRLIQNIFTPIEMMQELSRILSPRSYFVFSYFNRRSLLRIFRFGARCFKRIHTLEHIASFGKMCGTHPYFFRQLIRNAGLENKAGKGAGLIYQITNNAKPLQRLVEKNRIAGQLMQLVCFFFDMILGALNLSLWQFTLLVKKPVENTAPMSPPRRLSDLLMCPQCGNTELLETHEHCQCDKCHTSYPKKNGIYDFRLNHFSPIAAKQQRS